MSGVSAQGGPNLASVAWTANSEGAAPEGFYVEVSGPEGFAKTVAVPAPANGTEVAGLKNGIEYSFRVTAATRDGSAPSSDWVTATPTTGMEGVVAGVIVEFEPGSEKTKGEQNVPGEDRVEGVDLTVGDKVADDAVLVELSEPVDVDTATRIADDLEADAEVAWAEPDQFFFTSNQAASDSVQGPGLAQPVTVPADSDYANSQWNLWDTYGISVGDGTEAMTDAWAGATGDGVNVAVIDTGITPHPDLDGQLVAGYDFVSNPEKLAAVRQANAPPVAFDGDYVDEATYGALGRDANPADPGDWRGITPTRNSSWHGTQMAGIIAAANNADGITGVAPNARIQPVRALSWRGGLLSDIAASITWASGGSIDGVPANENPSTVINMSFAVETICPVALQDAIDGARDRGAILVAAAGNASDDAAKFAPGNCNGVITIAASNRDGQRADYSNYGPTVDIAAPGGDSAHPIATTSNTGTQAPDQPSTGSDFGTSAAAAHVSAAAAVLASRNAQLTPDQAYEQLTGNEFTKAFANNTCDTANPDYSCGTGILSLAQIQTIASGDQDYAMSFNGTSQYAVATDATALGKFANFTVEAWFNPTSTACPAGSRCTIVARDGDYLLTIAQGDNEAEGTLRWIVWDDTGNNGLIDTGVVPIVNSWQHVAMVRSEKSVKVFYNGQLANSHMIRSDGTSSSPNPLRVGYIGYGDNFFPGQIDQVKVYDVALDATAIQEDMHSWGMYTGTTDSLVTVNAANGLAHYDFNEGPPGTTGTGTVYNRADMAAAGTNLRTVNGPTYTDVKQTTGNGNNTVVTFPRSYLTAAGGWRVPEGVSAVDTLVVGGGGGGGGGNSGFGNGGGGGGGGGVSTSTLNTVSGVVAVEVGAGGLAGSGGTTTGASAGGAGGASSLSYGEIEVSTTGGAGGNRGQYTTGGTGGTGGASGTPTTAGPSTSFAGGTGPYRHGGGGGGASASGTNGDSTAGNTTYAGAGGAGMASSITGTSVTYGGGGGGGSPSGLAGAGGTGGGGAGAYQTTTAEAGPFSGASGLGGGGGGGNDANYKSGASGGSGVVIVSYSTASSTCDPFESSYIDDGTVYRVLQWSDPAQTGCTWTPPTGVTSVDYLIVGGGGGGGGHIGGGGGGGEVVFGTKSSLSGSYTVVVGAGGAGGQRDYGASGGPYVGPGDGSGGASSRFADLSAAGGGGGGSVLATGLSGGSGGGGGGGGAVGSTAGGASVKTGSGLGNSGGGSSTTQCETGAGGGGGATQTGAAVSSQSGGAGGSGYESSITGISAEYGGGGGGGVNGGDSQSACQSSGQGGAGNGGGGDGGANPSTWSGNNSATAGQPGLDGTGGGGGGATGNGALNASETSGGDGGDGVVILRYEVADSNACVPFEYPSGNYTVVEFQGAGECDWTVPSGVTSVDVLAVGGGGGGGGSVLATGLSGGSGGGGGGGQVQFVTDLSVSGTVGVRVGAGGSGGAAETTGSFNAGPGSAGESSEFDSTVALGGEGGGKGTNSTEQDQAGDGGGSSSTVDGAETSTSGGSSIWDGAGGGAGAGADGSDGEDILGLGGIGGDGGLGYRSSITGASVVYGGGGGGGGTWDGTGSATSDGSGGVGGTGGGGAGAQLPDTAAAAGTDGIGGGGGGGGRTDGTTSVAGADGGDGVVIVRYTNTPGAPTISSATAVAPTDVEVVWSAPSHTGTSAISGYTVTSSPDDRTCTSATTSCTVEGLTAGESYTFTVVATNDSGDGPASDASSSVTPFGELAKFTVTATDGSAIGTQTAGTSFDIKVTAVDSSGTRIVTSFAGTVDLTSTSLFSNESGGTTSAFESGVLSSHAVTLVRADSSQTVTATQTGGSATGDSAAFTIDAGEATKLQTLLPGETAAPGTSMGKTESPSDVTAGDAVTVTVNAVDAYWNVVSTATPTVAISSSDVSAVLPSNAALEDGTKDFSVTLKTAGSQDVTATDQAGSGTLTASTSADVTVDADAASKLVVSSIGSQTAGVAFPVTVTLTDAYGNAVNNTGATGTVTLTRTSGTGALGGTTSGTIAEGSSAVTISGVTYSKAESGVVLTATGSGSSSLVDGKTGASSAFAVTAGTATQYSVSLSSTTPTAGGTVTVTAQLQDVNGNDVATSDETVTWSTTATGGSFASATSKTDANGAATVVYTVSQTSGVSGTITATDETPLTGTSATFTTQVGVADAAQSTLSVSASSVTVGGSDVTLTVQAKDQYGNNLATGGSTVAITRSSGTGTLSGVTDVGDGTYTATLTIPTASGSGTFSATLGGAAVEGDTGSAQTVTVTYEAGTATSLVITGSSSQEAGTTQDLTITAQDIYGNTATSYTGEKSLTFSGATQAPAGQMPAVKSAAGTTVVFGTATTIEFENGVATVSDGDNGAMTLYNSESATIAVTDDSDQPISSTGTDRLTVSVSPATAAVLEVTTEPVGGAPGGVLATQPEVTVIDAYGNTIPGSSASVVASIASGANGTLGGTKTVSASSGVATFTDLTLDGDQGETYTLSFASGDLTSATSASLDVDLYEDSSTDGGGWKLVAYGDGAILGGYLNAPSGRYDPATRTGKATFDATSFFNEASEVAISWNQAGFAAGGIDSYDYAVKWTLPTPADMTLTGDSGSCTRGGNACPAGFFTPVTIADIQGTSGLTSTQYMQADAFGVNYGNSYGLVSVAENWSPDTQVIQALYLGKPGGNQGTSNSGYFTTGGTQAGYVPSTAAIWVRTLTANKLSIDTNAAGAASGAAFTTQPAVAIQSSSDGVVTSDNSTVVTASVSGSAELVGTTTATASNGVATFTGLGVSGTAGEYTLTFSSGELTVATQSITVTAGSAVNIAVNGGNNQTATAGSAVATAPSVVVTDAQGNPVEGTSVTFTVASGDGSLASPGSPATVTTNSSGIATSPSWTLGTTAGANTLAATSSGLTGSPVTFTATGTVGSASLLAVATAAAGAASGAAFSTQPVVEITDANGNRVTSDSSTVVSVAVSTGGESVGTTTATASNGVATYLDLGISGLVGNYTLTFSADGLSDATDTVTLSVGTATALTITTAAGDTTYGTNFSPQPVITVVDSGGNTVTSWSTDVTATVKESGGGTLATSTATPASGVATFSGLGSDVDAGTQTVEYTSGALTMATEEVVVAQKTVTITASSPSVTYGDPVPEITPSYLGFVDGQDESVLTTDPTCTTTYTTTSNAGSSPETSCSGAEADNYTFSYTPGSVTIAKATPSLASWEDVSKTYLDPDYTITAPTATGVGGSALDGSSAYSSSDASVISIDGSTATVEGAGTATITATFTPDDTTNYVSGETVTSTVTVEKADQSTLTITSTSGTFGSALSLTATGGSTSGSISYTAENGTASGCTVTGSSLSVSSAGTCLVTATRLGDDDYNPVDSAQTTVTFAKATQTITFNAISDVDYGDDPFAVSATASPSGLAVSFSASDSAVCSVSETESGQWLVTISGGGDCTITASQAGNDNYEAAVDVDREFTVNKIAQAALSLTSPPVVGGNREITFGETLQLAASGGSGTGAVTFLTGTTGFPGTAGCGLNTTTGAMTYTSAGACTVRAQRAADNNYLVKTTSDIAITISKAGQVLAFTSSVPAEPRPLETYTPTVESVSAVTGSDTGLTPDIDVAAASSAVCSIDGSGEVRFDATGTCTLEATSLSSTSFNAATMVTQVIEVGSLNQTITFAQPANVAFGSSSQQMTATASSDLDVTFDEDTSQAACDVAETGLVTIKAVGGCSVTAEQSGNDQYAAASSVTRTFQVVAALPTAPHISAISAGNQAITMTFVAPGFTGGVSIDGYEVTADPDTGTAGDEITTTACDPSASPLACTISGLTNGTDYTVSVAAINSAGTGSSATASNTVRPATAAFAVSAFTATPGNEEVALTWVPLTNGQLGGGTFDEYQVEYSLAGEDDWTTWTDVNLGTQGTSSTTVTGLDNGESYDFRIAALTTANSTRIDGNTALVREYPSTVPSAPRTPVVAATTATVVQFSWQVPLTDGGAALSSPGPFTVTVTTSDPDANAVTCTPSGTNRYCTASGLSNGALYTFSVVANNRMGPSVAATTTYSVPSDDATLSALTVTGSGAGVTLSPAFTSANTAYSASVANGITSVTVTPTVSDAGASVSVDGEAVASGSASQSIALSVGENSIAVVVTASDTDFTSTYTITITRAAAPAPAPTPVPTPSNGGSTPTDPVTPPTPVMDGDDLAVVTEGDSVVPVVLQPTSADDGWEALGTDFDMVVRTEEPDGAPMPLAADRRLAVPQGGRVQVAGDGYQSESVVRVFMVPRTTSRSGLMPRAVTGAMFLGETTVNSAGDFAATFTVPPSVNIGDYVLQINGVSATSLVRSVNMGLEVIPGKAAMRVGMVQRAGFYQGFSDQFSDLGKSKLRQLVRSVPKEAQAVRVEVAGVSVGLDSLKANAVLAAERASKLAEELEERGIQGEFTVTVTANYTADGAERSLAGKADVLTTKTGKPLSTVTILFQEPT